MDLDLQEKPVSTEGSDAAVGRAAASGPQRRLPGETGIWVFVMGDLVIFSAFFVTLFYYRSLDVALFAQAQRAMSQFYGVLNTVLLLTSSLFVAMAVRSLRSPHPAPRRSPGLIAAAGLCGLGFVVVKAFEWSEKIAAGHTLGSNDFFMFYFMFTGIHLAHVLVGLAILAMVYFVARKPQVDAAGVRAVEAGGIFWHLVDLLWIILFALFYLVK